jgi:predicted phage-related endonuclease
MTSKADGFLASRKDCLGGSDAHHLFSLPPYGCLRKLWYQKHNVPEDYPFDGNAATERGNYLEPIIAEMYAKKTKRAVVEVKQIRMAEDSRFAVHVDRMVSNDKDPAVKEPEELITNYELQKLRRIALERNFPGPWGVLEIKSPGRESYYKAKREGLLEAYILQLQWGMMVTGATWGAFSIHCADPWETKNWDVQRDDTIIKELRKAGESFWKLDNPPDRLPAKSKQCQKCKYRYSCQGERMLDVIEISEVPVDNSLLPVLNEYIEAKELVDEAEALTEEVRSRLEPLIGDRAVVDVTGHRVYFRPQTQMRMDATALAKAYDELKQHVQSGMTAVKLLTELPQFSAIEPIYPSMALALGLFLETPLRFSDSFRKPSVSRPLRVFSK